MCRSHSIYQDLASAHPDTPPPAYGTDKVCNHARLAHFKFAPEACALLVDNAISMEVCEEIRSVLQYNLLHWSPAFQRAGLSTDMAEQLCDIFEGSLSDELQEVLHLPDSEVEGSVFGLIDLTLDSDDAEAH
jgi:hypothetical protein